MRPQSTQSVTLVSQFQPEDLVIVETRHDASGFLRIASDGLEQWLDDYRIGELWEKSLLGGTIG